MTFPRWIWTPSKFSLRFSLQSLLVDFVKLPACCTCMDRFSFDLTYGKKRDRNRHGCGDTYHGRSKSNCLTNCNYFCSHCIHFKNFSMPSVFRIDGSFAHLQGRHLSFAQAQAKNRALCTVAIIYALRSAVVPKWIRLSRIFSFQNISLRLQDDAIFRILLHWHLQ